MTLETDTLPHVRAATTTTAQAGQLHTIQHINVTEHASHRLSLADIIFKSDDPTDQLSEIAVHPPSRGQVILGETNGEGGIEPAL